MPARCESGFVFENDLVSSTLETELTGGCPAVPASAPSSVQSLEARWVLHCGTCPRCTRLDTPSEACVREDYQWKRAQLLSTLSAQASRQASSARSHRTVAKAHLPNSFTRQLLREMVHLRRQLLRTGLAETGHLPV